MGEIVHSMPVCSCKLVVVTDCLVNVYMPESAFLLEPLELLNNSYLYLSNFLSQAGYTSE